MQSRYHLQMRTAPKRELRGGRCNLDGLRVTSMRISHDRHVSASPPQATEAALPIRPNGLMPTRSQELGLGRVDVPLRPRPGRLPGLGLALMDLRTDPECVVMSVRMSADVRDRVLSGEHVYVVLTKNLDGHLRCD